MGLRVSAADPAAVQAAVEAVRDPELPPVTVGTLGMLHDLRVSGRGEVEVELLPTWSGCPATEMIAEDVRAAVTGLPGVRTVTVRFRFDPPWTSDRISPEGHAALASFGIAPPRGTAEPAEDLSSGAARLPLLSAAPAAPTPCPYCHSVETLRESPFGPTPCRTLWYCNACRQPFEAFKNV